MVQYSFVIFCVVWRLRFTPPIEGRNVQYASVLNVFILSIAMFSMIIELLFVQS